MTRLEEELIEILLLTKERLSAIDVKGKYAYAYFIREQKFLEEVLTEIPGAVNTPGIYFSPFIETGYKEGYPSYKVVLMQATILKTINAIEKIILELRPVIEIKNEIRLLEEMENLLI